MSTEFSLQRAQEKMAAAGASDLAIRTMRHYFLEAAAGATGFVPESTIEPLEDVAALKDVATLEDASPHTATHSEALDQTVILKLNGGLGTSMGMDRAKSLLEVRDGKSFLDIIVQQVRSARERYGARLPLIFMNSFRTRADTLERVPSDIVVDDLPLDFIQGMQPKLAADTLEPVEWPANPELEWYPPGHGDIYTVLQERGIIRQLLEHGYRYMATSNADNLGAYPSAELAAWFAESGAPFAMEVAARTKADNKGGHLARRRSDGRIVLREVAQTPASDMDAFTDETKHRFFNTNNLWFNLGALAQLLEEGDGIAGLPLIVNHKTVDPADPTSTPVVHLETAMGAIIEQFDGAQAILVPRSRFLPVKNTADLFLVRSDAFDFGDDGAARVAMDPLPSIDLDPTYFRNIADFDERVGAIPSVRELESLTVRGDVRIDPGMHLAGHVRLP